MRYYAVKILDAPGGFPVTPGAYVEGAQFCSIINGRNDPSALRCQMQIELRGMDGSAGGGFLRLWGVDMKMVDQSADLTGAKVQIYGGFYPGLELAKWESRYSGLLYQGQVNGAFGNWNKNDITLDIMLNPGSVEAQGGGGNGGGGGSGGDGAQSTSVSRLVSRNARIGRASRKLRAPVSISQFDNPLSGITGDIGSMMQGLAGLNSGGWLGAPLNLIHDMKEGMGLEDAIKQTATTAFPNMQFMSLIKSGMKLDYHDAGAYQTSGQWAAYVKTLSQSIGGDKDYHGVTLYPVKNMVIAHDFTKDYSEFELAPWDLIGQPTWGGKDDKNKMLVNFMTPMRSDIFPTVKVHLPDTLQGEEAGMNVRQLYPLHLRDRIHFNGPVQVIRVIIVGDSRNPAGESWALSCTGLPGGPGGGAAISPIVPGGGDASQTEPVRLMRRGRGVG